MPPFRPMDSQGLALVKLDLSLSFPTVPVHCSRRQNVDSDSGSVHLERLFETVTTNKFKPLIRFLFLRRVAASSCDDTLWCRIRVVLETNLVLRVVCCDEFA